MKRSRREDPQVDSLIIVMMPFSPRYDASLTHQGATGEEKKTVKNMMKSDKEIYEMAKEDIAMLQKKEFTGKFKGAAVYPYVIFPGSFKRENSLKAAMEYMKGCGCVQSSIRNLAVNISAHGNPETVGNKFDISLSPDDEGTGLAPLLYGYVSANVAAQTELSFYLLSCNSAYVDYGNKGGVLDCEEAKGKVLSDSYVGRFHGAMVREASEEDIDLRLNVSGFRGFLGRTNKNKMTVSSRRDNDSEAKFIGVDRVRFVVSNINGKAEVSLPENFRFEVFGVERSMTANEAIDAKIGISCQLENLDLQAPENGVDNDNLSKIANGENDVFENEVDDVSELRRQSPSALCLSTSFSKLSQNLERSASSRNKSS